MTPVTLTLSLSPSLLIELRTFKATFTCFSKTLPLLSKMSLMRGSQMLRPTKTHDALELNKKSQPQQNHLPSVPAPGPDAQLNFISQPPVTFPKVNMWILQMFWYVLKAIQKQPQLKRFKKQTDEKFPHTCIAKRQQTWICGTQTDPEMRNRKNESKNLT